MGTGSERVQKSEREDCQKWDRCGKLEDMQAEERIAQQEAGDGGVIKKGNFRQFLKASLIINANGELTVAISSGQESFKISLMTENNSWIILDEDCLEYKAGVLVPVIPFATGIYLCHRM